MAEGSSYSLFLTVLAVLVLGCGEITPEQSFIESVNADDKSFKGEWIYKSQIAGQFTFSVRTRMSIEVSREKFHLVAKWTGANPPSERRTEEWIYDGEVLWQLIPSRRQANWLEIDEFEERSFWKMPLQMSPFAPPKDTGKEEIVAGRTCKVLQIKGRYDQGDVTLTYWIDKERNLLLKKEHLLKAGGMVLAHEVYECKSIEFDPVFPQKRFEVKVPSDWVKTEKSYLDCEVLNTKF